MKEIKEKYNPKNFEDRIYKKWEESGFFKPSMDKNKKYYSIVIFQIELNNKSIVTVKGYNEIADYCYKNLSKGNYCVIQGKINVKEINKLDSIVGKETFEIEINLIEIENHTKFTQNTCNSIKNIVK